MRLISFVANTVARRRFNAFKSAHTSDDKSKHGEGIEIKGVSTAASLGGASFRGGESEDISIRERATSFTPPDDCRIDLTFTDLSVTLANGLKILNGVTGELKSGTMTAIMGPSGCGKSTFMNALTYRIRDGGTVGGEVREYEARFCGASLLTHQVVSRRRSLSTEIRGTS